MINQKPSLKKQKAGGISACPLRSCTILKPLCMDILQAGEVETYIGVKTTPVERTHFGLQ